MKISITAAAAAAVTLLPGVRGHMVMNHPVPYNFHTGDLVTVEPLSATNPFPCQGRFDHVDAVTSVEAGSNTLVNFTGGAQHGGGSCQFAVTYDFPPPADKSKWKTIYTIIGGCPVAASAKNLVSLGPQALYNGREDAVHCNDDSGTNCIRQFEIPIPKELRNGNATFAWTWFNNIGNREMYMNCAPISITGGAEDDAFFDTLPNIFAANIPGECAGEGGRDGILNIPNPGKAGEVIEPPTEGVQGTCENPPIPVFEKIGDGGAAFANGQSGESSSASSTTNPTRGAPSDSSASTTSAPEAGNSVATVTTVTTLTVYTSTTVFAEDTATSTQLGGGNC